MSFPESVGAAGHCGVCPVLDDVDGTSPLSITGRNVARGVGGAASAHRWHALSLDGPGRGPVAGNALPRNGRICRSMAPPQAAARRGAVEDAGRGATTARRGPAALSRQPRGGSHLVRVACYRQKHSPQRVPPGVLTRAGALGKQCREMAPQDRPAERVLPPSLHPDVFPTPPPGDGVAASQRALPRWLTAPAC